MACVKFTEEKVKIGDIDIKYVRSSIEGNNPSKTLVCIPGAMGTPLLDFKPQIENLPKLLPEYQIIAWNPPGQGSSGTRNITIDFLEDDAEMVKEFMDALNIPKFSVLGWSNGGTSAMILAGKYSENVDKLIIFGSVSYLTTHEMKIYKYVSDIRNWSDELRLPKEELYGFEYFQRKYNENVVAMSAIFSQRKGDLCRSYLKDIEAETLILHGERDLLVSKEQIPYLLKNISNSKLFTFPQGAHDIHLKYSSEFNKRVADFLMD